MGAILEFKDEFRWLSNFWPCKVIFEGLEFNSVEAAYVAAKTVDIHLRRYIQQLKTAGECKRFGRDLDLRHDWCDIRIDVMTNLIRQKFASGTELAAKLISTRSAEIIEGNSWNDTFWGVCRGKGENNLGKIIMMVRDELNP
jgi:N-glycosidase YbiA